MRLSVLLVFLLATRLAAQVELPDLRVQNAGGTVVDIYDVKLLHVDPDGIRVTHSAGSAKVPYELLPDDLQTKFGFTAEQAKQHRDGVAVARQKAAEAAAIAAKAEAQILPVPSTLPVAASSYSSFAAASTTRTSLGYTLPAIGSTRSYYSSSRSRSRYYSSPSCRAYSSPFYYVYYYNTGNSCGYSRPVSYSNGSSCGTTSTTSTTCNVGVNTGYNRLR